MCVSCAIVNLLDAARMRDRKSIPEKNLTTLNCFTMVIASGACLFFVINIIECSASFRSGLKGFLFLITLRVVKLC